MAIDKFELEGIFEKFIEKCYEPDLQKAAIKGIESIQIDFLQLAKFNPDIAEQLLDNPREAISALETAMMHKMQEWISGTFCQTACTIKIYREISTRQKSMDKRYESKNHQSS